MISRRSLLLAALIAGMVLRSLAASAAETMRFSTKAFIEAQKAGKSILANLALNRGIKGA